MPRPIILLRSFRIALEMTAFWCGSMLAARGAGVALLHLFYPRENRR